MKVARFGKPRPLLSAQDLFGALSSVGPADYVLTSDGSNSVAFGSNVQTIWADGSNLLLGPSINIAAGSNVVLTLDQGSGGSSPSNTVRIHSTGGGSVSYGSNSNQVGTANAAGASTAVSRVDHVHQGVHLLSANGSNSLFGDVNLAAGTGISLGVAGQTITILNTGVPGPPGSGGGGGSGFDLDTYTIDPTYGDDFTGAALAAPWTRRNFTSGAETYQLGKNATYMRIAMTSRAAGDGYFQTAPGGDWTFAMAFVMRYWPINKINWSLCVVDSAGTGLGMTMHNSPLATMTAGITTYTTYSGSFQQNTSLGAVALPGEKKVWLYLRKASGNYFGAASFDGEVWGPETPAFASAITVDRVGMIVHPLGGIQTTGLIEVDWFNKIA